MVPRRTLQALGVEAALLCKLKHLLHLRHVVNLDIDGLCNSDVHLWPQLLLQPRHVFLAEHQLAKLVFFAWLHCEAGGIRSLLLYRLILLDLELLAQVVNLIVEFLYVQEVLHKRFAARSTYRFGLFGVFLNGASGVFTDIEPLLK